MDSQKPNRPIYFWRITDTIATLSIITHAASHPESAFIVREHQVIFKWRFLQCCQNPNIPVREWTRNCVALPSEAHEAAATWYRRRGYLVSAVHCIRRQEGGPDLVYTVLPLDGPASCPFAASETEEEEIIRQPEPEPEKEITDWLPGLGMGLGDGSR
ncbi:hypothetical protein MMC28_007705 [Mycoblastus sanguinarius]|nr:hypothetical protein [Mycoblastus sanguinarius]